MLGKPSSIVGSIVHCTGAPSQRVSGATIQFVYCQAEGNVGLEKRRPLSNICIDSALSPSHAHCRAHLFGVGARTPAPA